MRKIVEVETREEKLDERKNEIEARGKSLEISLYIRRIETQLAYGIKMRSVTFDKIDSSHYRRERRRERVNIPSRPIRSDINERPIFVS